MYICNSHIYIFTYIHIYIFIHVVDGYEYIFYIANDTERAIIIKIFKNMDAGKRLGSNLGAQQQMTLL